MLANDELQKVLDGVHAKIEAADQKAAALLTIAGVLIAFPAPSILVPASPATVPFAATVLAATAAFAFVVSVGGALAVLFPRTKNETDTPSLIFFGDIGGLKKSDYAAAVGRANSAQHGEDIIAQIHINSRIACTKHSHFKLAVRSLVVGIAFLIASYAAITVAAKSQPVPAPAVAAGRTP